MKTLSKTEAAYAILKRSRKPLHTKDIVEKAISEGMIKTKGKTPNSTMNVDLLLENRRRTARNIKTRFVKVGPAIWALTEWKIK